MAGSMRDKLPVAAKRAFWLAGIHFLVLMAVGVGLIVQDKWLKEPVFSVKGIAPSVSSRLFADMLRLEMPLLSAPGGRESPLSGGNVLAFLVEMLTDVNPRDRHTLIAGVLPGIREDAVPLKGQLGRIEAPIDYAPPPGLFERQNRVSSGESEEPSMPAGQPGNGTNGAEDRTGAGETGGSGGSGQAGSLAGNAPDGGDPAGNPIPGAPSGTGATSGYPDTGDRKVVFIYHSHNRESWVPELKDKGITKIGDAFDAETNITLVGKKLAERLEELGIGATHSDTDYFTEVKNYNWNFSYKYSQRTVEEALAANRDLVYLFDIHRDSQRREITTAEIDGTTYAQVYFIIGRRNPDWKENEAFAGKLHDALERLKPGISRGIWGKGAGSGNGEYNQSVSETSVLIEIGGPENTLEECYRTAEVLAEAIAEVYWEAERVNADG